MNRYLAEGIVTDLVLGKTVLVLGELRNGIRESMACVLHVLEGNGFTPDHLTVRRANGHESIRLTAQGGKGRVDFSSVHSSLRGHSPDVVLIDCDPYALGGEWWFEFSHTIGRRAEVIR